jgi:hypothetical protein
MSDKIAIICPTYNRRKFLPYIIYQFKYQTYPKNLLYLYILDDSEISNIDLFNTINDMELRSRIIYIHDKTKRTIGAKRNILNSIVKNIGTDFVVCFDDDDYYPPTKIANDIPLLKNSNKLIGGISTVLIYYPHLKQIYKFGMNYNYITRRYYYGHASNGTFIYNVKYLNNNSYNDLDKYAEEKHFLRNYELKLCRFNINSYIMISHNFNTVEKLQFIKRGVLLKNKLNDFIDDIFLLNFYNNLK